MGAVFLKDVELCHADEKDLAELSALGKLLWPGHTTDELKEEFLSEMKKNAHFFLLRVQGCSVGFAQCALRHDYVEGTDSSPVGYLEGTDSSPVGYLEGIFVKEGHRGKGYGRRLLKACEEWAKQAGCCEFASDCESANASSRLFHLHTGFQEANRIICFVKKL